LRADCSALVLYCITITWQQIFKGSLQVTAVGVLPLVTVERGHLGKKCSETVTTDSVKPRSFMLFEIKHE